MRVITSLFSVSLFYVAHAQEWSHKEPVRVKAAGEVVSLESPGFAAPHIADIDGNGKRELLVGQFNGGKMKVYSLGKDENVEGGKWLAGDGVLAQMPGVG